MGCGQLGDDPVATVLQVVPDASISAADADASSGADISVPPETGIPPLPESSTPLPDITIDIANPPVDAAPPCEALSPVIAIQRVNGDKTEACTGQLAAHTFTHVLCACEDLRTGSLITDALDSNSGVDAGANWGAAVGIGGAYISPGYQKIGGSLTIAGLAREFMMQGLDVAGDLRIASNAALTSATQVQRDAWVTGRVVVFLGWAYIGRNLNLGPTASFSSSVPGLVNVGAATNLSAQVIEPPCGCGPADKLDLNTMVSTGISKHENARISLEPNFLNDVAAPGTILKLECGRFYLEKIGGAGPTVLRIDGRVALFVDGNVQISSLFQLQVAPGAELDMFIRGNLTVAPGARLGEPSRPAATRIYVGGAGDIQIPVGAQVSANLYAPNANVAIAESLIAGSVYGRNLATGNNLVAHYDRAILSQGLRCAPPTTCDKCHTCNGGTACISGTCSSCRDDTDCCVPLVCDQGACLPLRR